MWVLGASRYRSSGISAPTAPASSYLDPYTGASRYSGTSQAAAPTAPAPGYIDPFTGASRYSGSPQPPPPAAKTLPVVSRSYTLKVISSIDPERQAKYITFKQASVSAMQGKLHQFDEALQNEIVRFMHTSFSNLLTFASPPLRSQCIQKKWKESMKLSTISLVWQLHPLDVHLLLWRLHMWNQLSKF